MSRKSVLVVVGSKVGHRTFADVVIGEGGKDGQCCVRPVKLFQC